MSKPGTAKTFQNYADLVFISYVKSYIATRHQAEAKGARRRFNISAIAMPRDWKGFLRVDENKRVFQLPMRANQKPAHC